MRDPAPPALRLEGIHKAFGAFSALGSIDLSIGPGELVCFLGPSGCGKTTLLRIIAGLERQTRGRVIQFGRDISAAPPAARDYGIVFQSYALFPNLTVADNVGYGLVNRRKGRAVIAARVAELLALVGLPDSGPKYPSQLSGGQQQRIALARALATAPGLLLLDEPLSALDAKVRERLRGEIRLLQQRLKVTTILVTHDQEEALSMADRIVVMRQGVIEQVGTPSDVYERPATPFVAEFLGRVNVLRATCIGADRYRVGQREIVTTADGVAHEPAARPGVAQASLVGSGVSPHMAEGAAAPHAFTPGVAVPQSFTPGNAVRLYLRPEDRALADSGPVQTRPNAQRGLVRRVDYLGTYCLAEVEVEGFDGQRMLVYLSLNQLHELDVREGGVLPFALRGERVRVFEQLAA
jgi:iron(III) transport system ATP-binding protein